MKLKLTLIATSFMLSACMATKQNQVSQLESVAPVEIIQVASAPENNALPATEITLEKIMSNPDWMGRSPESWYWGDDNTVLFKQKEKGSARRDLFLINLQTDETKPVSLAKLHAFSHRDAVYNQSKTEAVYVFQNNIYIKSFEDGAITQLTKTSSLKSDAQFLTNGNVSFRSGNVFYEMNRLNGQLTELANISFSTNSNKNNTGMSYLGKEQSKLIQFIAKKQKDAALAKKYQHKLYSENKTLSNSTYYFKKGYHIAHASLSPTGKHLIISIAKQEKHDAKNIMPNYITESGNIAAEPARRRVADNRQYDEEIILLNLSTGEQHALSYSSLPGFNDDVLADVKKENYTRENKTYKSEKQPRHFYVMWTEHSFDWNEQGDNVAFMIEAWDNKDRWLATVDVKQNKLVNQHRLHDDAWINWNFNEFGWVNNQSLYFLSEESGYSQLYSKNLSGPIKQLTRGQFEINDVTLMPNGKSFVFQANKTHPGIYEIYRVGVNGGNIEPLTNLGGKNNYQLSPNGKKLLIEHSTVMQPPELYSQTIGDIKSAKRLTFTVSKEFEQMPWTAPSVVAIKSTHQSKPIYSKVYLPKNSQQSNKKLPAVMFTHGAGYLQNSDLGWSGYFREFMFHSLLTQHGYVVIDMDYRASAGYGRDWRTAIYRHMGKPELEDMKDGVNWLIANANVDKNRVATYGGSYGGFLTVMALFKEPELFQAGAALRLVSDWAYYNHGYTSNILNTPKDDPIAYQQSSPIYFAQGLTKPLLINAPMVDSNVFFEDSVRLMQRLIELEKKDVEIAIFPVESHGFKQPSSWLHEYRKIFSLFERHLK